MKIPTKSVSVAFLTLSAFVLGAGIFSHSYAQEGGTDSALLQKLDALVDQLASLASTNSSVDAEAGTGTALQQNALGTMVANPSCLDGYESWPVSTNRDDSKAWAFHSMPVGAIHTSGDVQQNWLDINGDGLIDHLYHKSQSSQMSGYLFDQGVAINPPRMNQTESCVYLNNGAGWDLTYKCVVRTQPTGALYTYEAIYYGDCADI